jgi:hypothetical protein
MYDPKLHSFPPEFDDFTILSVKPACDADFQDESMGLVKEILNEYGKDSLDFPDDAEKEFATEYLFGNRLESRKNVELSNRNNFHWLSIEARCLSIIYAYFSEYKRSYNLNDWELFNEINTLKEYVVADANSMIGYWKLWDVRKKIQTSWSKKGAQAKAEDARLKYPNLQAEANKVWDDHPSWNAVQVANKMYDQNLTFDLKPKWVARLIQNPHRRHKRKIVVLPGKT